MPDVADAIVNGDHEIARALAEKLRRDLMTGHTFELAAATLLSLVVDTALDWWWADSVAALLVSTLLLVEGLRTVASARSLAA